MTADRVPDGLPARFPIPRIGGGVGAGWHSIIERLHEQLLAIDPDYEVVQVKEKFGTLSYYVASEKEGFFDQARPFIDAAAEESSRTCERCGDPARTRRGSLWWKSLCDACDAARASADPID